MKTLADNLREMADQISRMLQELLLQYSSLYDRTRERSPVILITPHPYAYRDLSEAGRQIQSRLQEEYKRYRALLETCLKGAPRDIYDQFLEADRVILRTIEQEPTEYETTQQVLSKANEALQTQLRLLDNLYDPKPGSILLIPDTNALLYNPDLEKWRFDDIQCFTLVLVPTVLQELDELKNDYRKREDFRQKVESLINRIKEYRRRGSLHEGVPLVKGQSTLMAIALEPNMQHSLAWLDPSINDDRFLASVIEIMRHHPHSVVIAVSRDINLQNKAELARIPCIEPPEPLTV